MTFAQLSIVATDVCQASATNRICKVKPTNRETNDVTRDTFDCLCQDGYTKSDNNDTCQDINECEGAAREENVCADDTTTCQNTLGSYECACISGYIKSENSVIYFEYKMVTNRIQLFSRRLVHVSMTTNV